MFTRGFKDWIPAFAGMTILKLMALGERACSRGDLLEDFSILFNFRF